MDASRKISTKKTTNTQQTPLNTSHEQGLISPQDDLSTLFKADAKRLRSPQIMRLQRMIGNRATSQLVTGRIASGGQVHVQRDYLYYDRFMRRCITRSGVPPGDFVQIIIDGRRAWTTPERRERKTEDDDSEESGEKRFERPVSKERPKRRFEHPTSKERPERSSRDDQEEKRPERFRSDDKKEKRPARSRSDDKREKRGSGSSAPKVAKRPHNTGRAEQTPSKRRDVKQETQQQLRTKCIELAKLSLAKCLPPISTLLTTLNATMGDGESAWIPLSPAIMNVCRAAQLTLNADLGTKIQDDKVFLLADDYRYLFTVRRILQKMQSFLNDNKMVENIIPFPPGQWSPESDTQGLTTYKGSKFSSRPEAGGLVPTTKAYREDLMKRIPHADFSEVIDQNANPLHPDATIELPLIGDIEDETIHENTSILLHELAHAASELFDVFPALSDNLFHHNAVYARTPLLTIRNAESMALFIRTLIRLLNGSDPV